MNSNCVPYEGFSEIAVSDYSKAPWNPPKLIMDKVDASWRNYMLKKSEVFDGPLVRVANLWQDKETLNLKLQNTSYKYHLGTMEERAIENRANALFAAVNVITSDDKLVLGAVENGLYEGNINICAGAVNPYKDSVMGCPSVESAIRREIQEEFFLEPEDFTCLIPRYVLTEENKLHPSIMHIGRLEMDSEALEKKFNRTFQSSLKRGDKPELGKLYFMDASPGGIARYCREYSKRTQGRVLVILEDLVENPQRLEI